MRKLLFALLCFIAAACVAETIEFKSVFDFSKGAKVTLVEEGVFMISGAAQFYSAKDFEVNPDQSVTLGFDMRKSPDTRSCLVYVGFQCFDEDKVKIMSHHVRCENNSSSVLVADAVAGSKEVRIKMPPRFKKGRDWCLSFTDRKDCTGLDMGVQGWQSVSGSAADGSVVIKLNVTLDQDYPAGTPVHCHSRGAGMYSACSEKLPNDEWETIRCTVTGMQATDYPTMNKWFKGTKYAKVFFLVVTNDPNNKVFLKNVTLTH